MASNLSKGVGEDDYMLWMTDDYAVVVASGPAGYDIVNRNTGQIEAFVEQMTQAVISVLWMQDNYEEIMADPVREFTIRKERNNTVLTPQPQGGAITRKLNS